MSNDQQGRDLHERWLRRWAGYGVAGVVLAFLASVELAYMNPVLLMLVGILLAVGIIVHHDVLTSPEQKYWKTKTAVIILTIGTAAAIFTTEMSRVEKSISANRQRCLALQRDMLSAHPRKADGANLFQALSCRPRGEGSVFVPPTDRERRAGRALPGGGYLTQPEL